MVSSPLWSGEWAWRFPKACQPLVGQVRRRLCHCVHGRHPYLQQDARGTRRTPPARSQSSRRRRPHSQHRQMSILPNGNTIPRSYPYSKWLHARPSQYRQSSQLAYSSYDNRRPRLHQPRKPLSSVYQGLREARPTNDQPSQGFPGQRIPNRFDTKGGIFIPGSQDGLDLRSSPPTSSDGSTVHHRPRFLAILHRRCPPTVLPRPRRPDPTPSHRIRVQEANGNGTELLGTRTRTPRGQTCVESLETH